MAQLGRAATRDDILVSIHPRRLGIVGDGQSGDPSALILDGAVVASTRLTVPFLMKVAAAINAAGAVTLASVQPGDTVVAVLDMSVAPFTDTSANFESTITVAGQIQELNSTPSTHSCLFVVWPRS